MTIDTVLRTFEEFITANFDVVEIGEKYSTSEHVLAFESDDKADMVNIFRDFLQHENSDENSSFQYFVYKTKSSSRITLRCSKIHATVYMKYLGCITVSATTKPTVMKPYNQNFPSVGDLVRVPCGKYMEVTTAWSNDECNNI